MCSVWLQNSEKKQLSHTFIFSIFRDATGKFPEYPDEDDGGSAAIFKQKTPEEVEAELAGKVGSIIQYFYMASWTCNISVVPIKLTLTFIYIKKNEVTKYRIWH